MPEEIKISESVIVKDMKVEFVFDIPVYGVSHKEVEFKGSAVFSNSLRLDGYHETHYNNRHIYIRNGEQSLMEFIDTSFSRGYFDFGKSYDIIY